MLYYITHPQVDVDPNIPVDQWGLSALGRQRAHRLLEQPWVETLDQIISSTEVKALQTAALLADHCGLTVEAREGLGENDRTATGFVPPEQFEVLANSFFAEPTVSIRGWERAVDAQARIVAGLADVLELPHDRNVAIVGHGAVGTLWYCHLTRQKIDRCHDQPGQGHYFTIDQATQVALHHWRPVDDLRSHEVPR